MTTAKELEVAARHQLPEVHHRHVEIGDVRVFYREAGPVDAPTLLLLHGFPSASHQFRRLMDALGADYHVIAPDYPGFGHTEAPEDFDYSFEALADVTEGFVQALGVTRFVIYMFDFGGPVGFRIATRHPEWVAGLVIQNANAYTEGLSPAARDMIANRPGVEGAEDRIRAILELPVTRAQYEGGTLDRSLVAPDGWTLDQHFLDLPGRKEIQVRLALDYHSNVALYPTWQAWLRERRPPTLVVWGRDDMFFPEPGAHAYLRDLPDADVHVFDTGHFALEDHLNDIAPLIAQLLDATSLGSGGARKIAVIGATGRLGGAVATEAAERGHDVSELGSADVDATDPESIKAAVAGHDAVVVSVKGDDQVVPRAAKALLDALPEAGVPRLVFVGGGGSLEHAPGERFVDAPGFPPQFLATARDQGEALEIFRAADTAVRWSYVSPPPRDLVPGAKTGRYRAEARDTPITDVAGRSRITIGDFASAVIDAVDRDRFVGERFTVAY